MPRERETAPQRARRRRAAVGAAVALALVSFSSPGQGADAKGWVPPKAPVVKPVKPVKPVTTTVKPVSTPQVPVGAKFRCRDGSYSFVSKPALACWGHGGVAARV